MVRLGEDLGFDLVGLADTPGNAMDLWVAMTLAAGASQRVRLASCVTNLLTRHPAITASAAASVDVAAGGRTILGVGAGHSGVVNLGGAPTRARAAARRHGVPARAPRRRARVVGRRVVAARGGAAPGAGVRGGLGARSAARRGRRRRRHLHQLRPPARARGARDGARERGRGAARDGPRETSTRGGWPASTATRGARRLTRSSATSWASWPPTSWAPIPRGAASRASWSPPCARCARPTPRSSARWTPISIKRLGLFDYLRKRLAVAGTPEDCLEQARAAVAAGAQQLMFTVSLAADPERTVELFGREVLPALRR